MRSSENKARIVGTTLLTSIALLTAGMAGAQPEPPAYVRFNIVDVKPDMVDEFRAIQKQFSENAKKGGTPFRGVWRTDALGQTWRYLIVTPMESLAELGAATNTDQALIDRVLKCIVSRRSVIVVPMNDLSNPLPAGQEPKLAVTQVVRVAPGRDADYVSWAKSDYFPHVDSAGVHYLSGDVSLGGRNSYVHFILFDSYEEIAKGSPLSRGAGAEAARAIQAKRAGIVMDVESAIMRYDSELSYDARASN